LPNVHPPPHQRHDFNNPPPRPVPFFCMSGDQAGAGDIAMTKFYRTALTATLLAGLALPALAQTPAAPDTAAPATAAPQTDTAAPAKDAAPAKTKPVHHARHHHTVAQKKTDGATKTPDAGPTRR
jgi:type IV secretory pathway TrbL component